MPNWSYNNLTISGSSDKMKEFYDLAIKENLNKELSFRFSNVFPMPIKIKNTISPSKSAEGKKWMNEDKVSIRDSKLSEVLGVDSELILIPCENNTYEKCKSLKEEFGSDNWYDWNINNYGTKWDIEVLKSDSVVEDEFFQCFFDTAWSPPSSFLYNLQNKFQELDIKLTYNIEGSDDCGIFYSDVYEIDGKKIKSISNEEDEVTYISEDGRDIYFNNDDGEWHYHDDDEVCYEYLTLNPFE